MRLANVLLVRSAEPEREPERTSPKRDAPPRLIVKPGERRPSGKPGGSGFDPSALTGVAFRCLPPNSRKRLRRSASAPLELNSVPKVSAMKYLVTVSE